jgi:hypothetical protein
MYYEFPIFKVSQLLVRLDAVLIIAVSTFYDSTVKSWKKALHFLAANWLHILFLWNIFAQRPSITSSYHMHVSFFFLFRSATTLEYIPSQFVQLRGFQPCFFHSN